MKLSLNWVREFTDIKLPLNELVNKIGAQLGAVEEVADLGKKYAGLLIVKVASCEAHPNADKLSVCLIDDGGVAKNVKRDKDGHIQVVCGAPNVRMGMLAVWCPPGSVVPSTADKDPFRLESRTIRGATSQGMLASASELDLGDDHAGIVEVSEKVKPGTAFTKAYKLDDIIIDIENKMFTHRPDCFGMLGLAREIAGINHQAFTSPAWYLKLNRQAFNPSGQGLPLNVKNEVPGLVPRFMAVPITGVHVASSPLWLQTYLARVGIRPINNIVDLTNYYMVLTGQPLHAYDYDKLANGKLGVRLAKKGESVKLLGSKNIKLNPNDIVITDGEKAVGIGGVMGGADSEVGFSTKNIVLECATFDLYAVRKTAMAHGLFTDAVTRFTKRQSHLQNDRVLAKITEHITELAGGNVAGKMHDTAHSLASSPAVETDAGFINSRLGLNLTPAEMAKLLKNVEFEVELKNQSLKVKPPFWRTDIHIAEDVVEEVGRLYGYEHLPQTLPKRNLTPAAAEPLWDFKSMLRYKLTDGGANEMLTYSFVHSNLLKKVGQDPSGAFELTNALSPDLQYYRLSLLPSVLTFVHPNLKAGYGDFALFEINKTHHKSLIGKDKLPVEEERVALVVAANDKTAKTNYSGAAYYQAAKYLTYLLGELGIRPVFTPLGTEKVNSKVLNATLAPLALERSAYIKSAEGDTLGLIGEFKPAVQKDLKLPAFCAGFELNVLQLMKAQSLASPYVVKPRFPQIEQDICLKVKANVFYQELADFVWDELLRAQPENVYSHLTPIDIYQNPKDLGHKQITFRVSMASYERTMTDNTLSQVLDKIAAKAKTKLNAVRV